jgi:hypothetical protein
MTVSTAAAVRVQSDLPEWLAAEAREVAHAALAAAATVVDLNGSVTIRHGDWTVSMAHGSSRMNVYSAVSGTWTVTVTCDDDTGDTVATAVTF